MGNCNLARSAAESVGNITEFHGVCRMVTVIETVCELTAMCLNVCKHAVNLSRINKCPLLNWIASKCLQNSLVETVTRWWHACALFCYRWQCCIIHWCRLLILCCIVMRWSITVMSVSRPLSAVGSGGMVLSGCASVNIYIASRDVYLLEGFRWNFTQIFIMWVGFLLKRFLMWEVKGQGHDETTVHKCVDAIMTEACMSMMWHRCSLAVVIVCDCSVIKHISYIFSSSRWVPTWCCAFWLDNSWPCHWFLCVWQYQL